MYREINFLKIAKIDFTKIVQAYLIFNVSEEQRFKFKRNGPSHYSKILKNKMGRLNK